MNTHRNNRGNMKKLTGYNAGVNFGGWFSQCEYSTDRYDNFIKEEDFTKVKSWGFDHVRIPVDYNLFEDIKGNFIESGFARIDRVIRLCRQNGLNMVLDLHKAIGFSFDDGERETGLFESAESQQLFYALWRELARRYAKHSDMLAFELLNEVTLPEYMPVWNKMASTTIGIIREYSQDIKILVGGYYNNSPEAVPDIDVPVDDNIVFNFHCYEPIMFTHQGAYWIEGMNSDFRMPYKCTFGQYADNMKGRVDQLLPQSYMLAADVIPDEKFFIEKFSEAVKVAEEKGVYLYCGEYGVIELANIPDTLLWYKDIHKAFEKLGIGHALWSYREMDFDFVGERMDGIREEIIATSKGIE